MLTKYKIDFSILIVFIITLTTIYVLGTNR